MAATTGMSWYLDQIGRYPLLSPSLELELARAVQVWRNDPEPTRVIERRGVRARERFIQANLRLVVKVATKFRSFVQGDGFNDLVQAGNLGLVDAVERFDPARGYRFSTYAYFWIQMRITQHLEKNERTIRLPSSITYRVATIPKVLRRLMSELGREPTRLDLAKALDMSEAEIDRIFLLSGPCASLDAIVSTDGSTTTLGEMVAAPESPPDDEEDVIELRRQLQRLPLRAKQIVEGAYGIGQPQQKLGVLAQQMAIPRSLVVRILRQVEHDLAAILNPAARQLVAIDRVSPVDDSPWLTVITTKLGPAIPPVRRRHDYTGQLVLPLPARLFKARPKRRRRRRSRQLAQ